MIQDQRKLGTVFDIFERLDGSRIQIPTEWMEYREIWKKVLREMIYGSFPERDKLAEGKVVGSRLVYGGKAVLEEISLEFGEKEKITVPAEILRPHRAGKYPVIIWNRHDRKDICPVEEELVCQRGVVLASICRSDIAEDRKKLIDRKMENAYPGYSWGRIAQWAFGMSKFLDYIEQQEYCEPRWIVSSGHSRGGKVAMCAAIFDERFTMCHANASGCLGSGSLRLYGGHYGLGFGKCETVGDIEKCFGYWWGPGLTEYIGAKEKLIPVDGHLLRALIAPRAIITTEGCGDDWSNPYGTQIMWRAAQEVYEFLGVHEKNAIHYREGGHKFQKLDWEALADFIEIEFLKKEKETNVVWFRKKTEEKFDWKWERPFYQWRQP